MLLISMQAEISNKDSKRYMNVLLLLLLLMFYVFNIQSCVLLGDRTIRHEKKYMKKPNQTILTNELDLLAFGREKCN